MQGPVEENIMAQCLRYRRPVPEIIQNAPELDNGLDFYYDCFCQLNTSRIMGGPISVNSILQFGKLYELEMDELEDLQFHVHRLDDAYMNHEAEKNKKK